MKKRHMDKRGFSLVELMIALTILGVGLLAIAQMQMAAIYGSSSSRSFTDAINLARERIEASKVKGNFLIQDGQIINIDDDKEFRFFLDKNLNNSDLSDTANYDYVEVLEEDKENNTFNRICEAAYSDSCDVDGNYTRYVNVRNIPEGATDANAVMKEIAVVVKWKWAGETRQIEMRTLIGRRDYDFL